jgi:hypothetical protein
MGSKRKDRNLRSIRTVYYQRNLVVKTTASKFANNAVPNCIRHMQLNEYDATHVEVYDEDSGVLHAVIKRSIKTGDIVILFKREVEEGM